MGDLKKSFGIHLRALRKKKVPDVSGRAFAKLIGVSDTYLFQIENGKLPPPSLKVLTRIALVLNIPEESLFKEAGYPEEIVAPMKRYIVKEIWPLVENVIDEEASVKNFRSSLKEIWNCINRASTNSEARITPSEQAFLREYFTNRTRYDYLIKEIIDPYNNDTDSDEET